MDDKPTVLAVNQDGAPLVVKTGKELAIEPELMDVALEQIACGETIADVARNAGLTKSRLYKELVQKKYMDRYIQSLVSKGAALADEALEIADGLNENAKLDVRDRALKVDTRKWLCGKFFRNLFGEDSTFNKNGGVQINIGEGGPSRLVVREAEKVIDLEEVDE